MQYTPEEVKGWEDQLKQSVRLRNKLADSRIIETDAARQFALDEQISQVDSQVAELKSKLASVHGLKDTYGWEKMYDLIKKLDFDEDKGYGLSYLVNCDRENPKNLFWNAFDDKGDQGEAFQYYIVPACLTEMPNGFAERMIYEIISEELRDAEDGIHFVRHADTGRVRIEDLPMRRNMDRSISEFKAYVQKRFEFASTDDFDTFIQTGVPKLPYRFVSVVFELHERYWKPFVKDYIKWMMDTFQTSHPDVPNFIFFFVIYIENLHQPELLKKEQKELLALLEEVGKEKKATLLDPLRSVPLSDLKAWFTRVGRHDPILVDEIISLLVSGLHKEEQQQFHKDQLLHMKDIQELQKVIYQVANE